MEGLDHLGRWKKVMDARPAGRKGVEVPVALPNLAEDHNKEAGKAFAKGTQSMLQR